MPEHIIVLPENTVSTIATGMTTFITDLWPIWTFILAIVLGAVVITFLIHTIKK